MDPRGVTREQLIERAVSFAQLLGWMIEPSDCQVKTTTGDSARPPDERYHWLVMMFAQPERNPCLRLPMPMTCRIEWLGERLCATHFAEPSDRASYLATHHQPG